MPQWIPLPKEQQLRLRSLSKVSATGPFLQFEVGPPRSVVHAAVPLALAREIVRGRAGTAAEDLDAVAQVIVAQKQLFGLAQ